MQNWVKQMGIRMKEYAGLLPLFGKVDYVRLNTQPDKIYQALSAPGAAAAKAWYGDEVVLTHANQVTVIDSVGFRRYVYGLSCIACLQDGEYVVVDCQHAAFGTAVLEVRKPGVLYKHAIIERIYVQPERRRQGIATHLLALAKADFDDLGLDGKLTDEGAAFFGYTVRH